MEPSLNTSRLIVRYVRNVFLPQQFFNTCMNHVLGRMYHVLRRMTKKSNCGVSFGTVRITDIDTDDAVIFAETIEVLSEAFDR